MGFNLEDLVCDYIEHYVTRTKMFLLQGDIEMAKLCDDEVRLMADSAMNPQYHFFWAGDLSCFLYNQN